MIKKISTLSAIVAIVALLAIATPTWAQGLGCPYWSYPYPADLTPLYSVGAIPTPPYFALHPPVYYSNPVPRAYGYGPWAYPPYVTTPEAAEPKPQIIENQFVPKPAKQDVGPQKTASSPLRVVNPFVLPADRREETSIAAR